MDIENWIINATASNNSTEELRIHELYPKHTVCLYSFINCEYLFIENQKRKKYMYSNFRFLFAIVLIPLPNLSYYYLLPWQRHDNSNIIYVIMFWIIIPLYVMLVIWLWFPHLHSHLLLTFATTLYFTNENHQQTLQHLFTSKIPNLKQNVKRDTCRTPILLKNAIKFK